MQLLLTAAWADGLAVRKVYDPYVQPLGKELKFHAHFPADDESVDGNYLYKLGDGQSLNERWFVEGHLIGEGEQGSGSDLEGYELEPGIEVFLSQGRRMAVPFSAGDIRLEGAQKLLWQVALLAGINNKAPNMDLKLIVGYELYFRTMSVWFSPIADAAPRRDR